MDVPRERRGQARRDPGSRSWLAATALLATAAFAQQTGSLQGKLTDLYSRPLSGVTVILRNTATGSETRAFTAKDGTYRVAALAPGAYLLIAEAPSLGQGQVDGIVVTDGHASRVHTALALRMRPTPSAAAVAAIRPPTPPPSPAAAVPVAIENKPFIAPEIAVAAPPAPAISKPAIASSAPLPPVVKVVAINRQAAILAMAAGIAARLVLQTQAPAPRLAVAAVAPPSTDSAAVTATLTGEQLQSLPLNGRDWQQFTLDAQAAQASQNHDPDVSGGLLPGASVSVDGVSTRLAFGGRGVAVALESALISPGAQEIAIRELQSAPVTESPAGSAGSQFTRIETRSGSDHLHGQAFLFDRQNLLGARNPFTQWVKETAPATATTVPTFSPFAWSPGDRRATWGLGAGSALRRNRLSWFAALDGDQRNDPAVSTVKHPDNFFAQPTNDEMQVLSARLGLSSVSPVSEGLAAYSTMLESLAGLLGPAPRTSTQWTGFGRIDWRAAERHRFTLEGTGAHLDSPGGGLGSASESYGSRSFGGSRASELWLLARWEAFITPNLLAVTQASAGRQILARPPETPSPFEQTFNVNAWGQLPQMVVDSRYGFTIGNPARFGSGSYPDEQLYELQPRLDWVRGTLLLRSGFDLRHNADATSLLGNHTGTYHYASVENFASDALVFAKFGLNDALDPMNQHNCDQRGKAWRDSAGQLHGLGYLPCFSWYTQTLGPTNWHLETNDWAGFAMAQWQPSRQFVMSAGVRWERQQMPPPIALVNNPDLPLTQRIPSLGNQWAPRMSLAWGRRETHWPVLRLGYGMYFGRTPNSVLKTALTRTGSLQGDVNLFMRPTDNLPGQAGGAPPFPYVLGADPGTIEKPGAVEIGPGFRNAEIHQAVVAVEETLPGRILVSAGAMASLARRLPITIDTNFDPAVNPGAITYDVVDASGQGPIKSPRITVPFYASWPTSKTGGRLNPDYQQISELMSRANSTYEAGMLRVSRFTRRGISFHLRYTYAHAMDWNPNEGDQVSGASVLDPADFRQEYGTSDLDLRHSLSAMAIFEPQWKLKGLGGKFANSWMLSGIGTMHSGLPYTMRTASSLTEEFTKSGALIVALGPGMNGYGGDNRVYGVGRNTYRYPGTWKADVRLGRRFSLGHERELELLGESFNLFNHQNVTRIETTGYYIDSGTITGGLPSLNFLTGLKTGQTEFGQPLNVNATDFYRERQFDFGFRLRFKHDPES